MARKVKAPPGYVGIGMRYISLPFLLVVSTVFLALAVLYATTLHPVFMQKWFELRDMPEFRIDSPYLTDYSGSARLMLSDGTLLYEGEVVSAAAQGEGSLYDNGILVYRGNFEANEFSGVGRQYEDGALVYEGNFEKNMRNGKGSLYASDSSLIYRGDFVQNEISGQGKQYENGKVVYSGGFAEGLRDGMGTQYIDGRVVYRGSFLAGFYSGAGKLYGQDGRLVYDGEFLSGMYDGNGKLYENGALLYEGEFAAGKYNGEGTEYNTATGHPVFSGKYLDNTRMEAGILYDENGDPIVLTQEPSPKPDPLSLFGMSYPDAVTLLTQSGIATKEQKFEDALFVIDEGNGVIYSFQTKEDGSPDYLFCIYYYGLRAAAGVVVGADISDIPGGEISTERINAAELLVLGYSNTQWGRDAAAAKSQAIYFAGNRYAVTAFYLPPETPAAGIPADAVTDDAAEEASGDITEAVPDDALEEETEEASDDAPGNASTDEPPDPASDVLPDTMPGEPPEPSGQILFLRIDYIAK